MKLRNIILHNFKNYEELKIDFSKNINCFYGNNGSGKTNILDAIYYLSFCKSFFNSSDKFNLNHYSGADYFSVKGEYSLPDLTSVQGVFKTGKKVFIKEDVKYKRLIDHIGLLPLVFVSPSDSELINGSSEVRRKLMDQILSQTDSEYLIHIMDYNKALSQRNSYLKNAQLQGSIDESLLEIWDNLLVKHGVLINEKRQKFIYSFNERVQHYYKVISKDQEQVSLGYKTHLDDFTLKELLTNNRKIDLIRGITTKGIHKDDLVFKMGNHSIKHYGSQGQQKSFLLALRLAQLDYLAKISGKSPILLLDDIFDKLDQQRVQAILNIVSKDFKSQVFITHTDKERIFKTFNQENEVSFFEVINGSIKSSES